jgi:hypothetical protein
MPNKKNDGGVVFNHKGGKLKKDSEYWKGYVLKNGEKQYLSFDYNGFRLRGEDSGILHTVFDSEDKFKDAIDSARKLNHLSDDLKFRKQFIVSEEFAYKDGGNTDQQPVDLSGNNYGIAYQKYYSDTKEYSETVRTKDLYANSEEEAEGLFKKLRPNDKFLSATPMLAKGGEVLSDLEDGELVFRAATKGEKYVIEVVKNSDGLYDINEFKSGKSTGHGYNYSGKTISHYVNQTVQGGRTIDGINYIVSLNNLPNSDKYSFADGGNTGNFLYNKGDVVYVFQYHSNPVSASRKATKHEIAEYNSVPEKYIVGSVKEGNRQKWCKVEIVERWSSEPNWETYKVKQLDGYRKEKEFIASQDSMSTSNKETISIGYMDKGGSTQIERVLYGRKKGEPDYNEQVICTKPDKFEEAKKWAMANGYVKFRIASINVAAKPDFAGAINKKAEGGHIGFKGLVKKVEKRLTGTQVPAKYRKDYGKKYSKGEAHEAATRIAGAQKHKMGLGKGGNIDKIYFKKINQWDNTILYQATNGKLTYNVEVETVKDKLGNLKKVECSLTGHFEEYSMEAVKERVRKAFPEAEAKAKGGSLGAGVEGLLGKLKNKQKKSYSSLSGKADGALKGVAKLVGKYSKKAKGGSISPQVTLFGKKCVLEFGEYNNGTIAITAYNRNQPFSVCTVNWEQNFEGDNYKNGFQFPAVVIKNYGENEGMVKALEEAGVVEKGGAYLSGSGGKVEARHLTEKWQAICKEQLGNRK